MQCAIIGELATHRNRRVPVHLLTVKVKPAARTARLVEGADGVWLASLRSPPVDGKANAELVAMIARQFDCPRSAVSIKSGAGARLKRVRIETRYTFPATPRQR